METPAYSFQTAQDSAGVSSRAVVSSSTRPAATAAVLSVRSAADTPFPFNPLTAAQDSSTGSSVYGQPPLSDNKSFASDSTLFAADGIFRASDTLSVRAANPCREISPQEMYGERSVAVRLQPTSMRDAHTFTGDPFFQLFLLLLAALYARFIYLHLGDVYLLFARASKDSVTRKQRLFDDQSNVGHSRFLNAAWAVGLLFCGACALRFGGEALTGIFSSRAALPVSLAATLGCFLLMLVQFGVLALAGTVTLTQSFVGQLIHLRRTYFALVFLAAAPVVLLYMLSPSERSSWCLYLLAAETVVIAALFLKESLSLFISKKIPILHWFLYLCIVECLPISFIAVVLMRQ